VSDASDARPGVSWRALAGTVGLIEVAAGGLLLIGNRSWITVQVHRQPPFGPLELGVPGRHLYAALPGLAVVALLIGILVLVSGGWARLALGGLLLLTGGWTAWLAARFLAGQRFLAAQLVADRAGIGSDPSRLARHPIWPGLSLLCSILLAAAAVVLLLRARRWPGGLSRRYAAPAEAAGAADPWRALDRGEDPTIYNG